MHCCKNADVKGKRKSGERTNLSNRSDESDSSVSFYNIKWNSVVKKTVGEIKIYNLCLLLWYIKEE